MAETNICESGTPSGFVALSTLVNAGVLSSRPAAGQAGRLYFVTDAGVQRWTRDDGAAWQDVLDHWDQVTGKPATFAPVSHGTSAHTGAVLPGTADEDLGARFLNVKGSAAPANPGAGDRRLYVDSGTGKLSVKTSGGQSVSLEEQAGGSTPTGTGFRHITSGAEDAAAKLVDTADVNDGQITNGKLANVLQSRIKGRVTAGSGPPEDLTGTQATTLLDVFSSSLKGLAPSSAGGTTNFLRADGAWTSPGAAGFTMTEVEKNLGATPRRAGKFQITGAGLTAGKPVLVQQAHGPYTGKGTRADEAEMDQVNATGKVLNGTTIDVYWNARTKVRGNMKFNYVVSG